MYLSTSLRYFYFTLSMFGRINAHLDQQRQCCHMLLSNSLLRLLNLFCLRVPASWDIRWGTGERCQTLLWCPQSAPAATGWSQHSWVCALWRCSAGWWWSPCLGFCYRGESGHQRDPLTIESFTAPERLAPKIQVGHMVGMIGAAGL